MDVVTLVIAAAGLALGVASLTWQMVAHSLTGGRVKTTLKVGALSPGGLLGIEANKVTHDSLKELTSQGYSQLVIAVVVRNVGRLPVTVNQWGIKSSQGVQATPMADSIGRDLPHRIEAGASETWAMSLDKAFALGDSSLRVLGKDKRSTQIVGVVELGDGRKCKTPEAFPVSAS